MKCPHCGKEHPDDSKICPFTENPISQQELAIGLQMIEEMKSKLRRQLCENEEFLKRYARIREEFINNNYEVICTLLANLHSTEVKYTDFNHVLYKISCEYQNFIIGAGNFSLYNFQNSNNGILKLADFLNKHQLIFPLRFICQFIIRENLTTYDRGYNKYSSFERIIPYLHLTKKVDCYVYIPILYFYLGCPYETYTIIDEIDDNHISMQLYYYYLRSALDIKIEEYEIQSIINASYRLYVSTDEHSEVDDYYKTLIEDIERDLSTSMGVYENISAILNQKKSLFTIDGDLNFTEINEYFHSEERRYSINKSSINTNWLYLYFEIPQNINNLIIETIINHDLQVIRKSLIDSCLPQDIKSKILSQAVGGFNLMSGLQYSEQDFVALLSNSSYTIDDIQLLILYQYMTGGNEETALSNLEFVSLIQFCVYLKNRQRANSRNSVFKRITLYSLFGTGIMSLNVFLSSDILAFICATLPVIGDLVPSSQMVQNSHKSQVFNITEEYYCLKTQIIGRLKLCSSTPDERVYLTMPIMRLLKEYKRTLKQY